MIAGAPLGRLLLRRCAQLALAALLAAITTAAGLALLGVSGWFVTATALTLEAATFNLILPSAAIRGLALVRIVARYGERLTGHDATLRWLAAVREWCFRRIAPLAPFDPSLWRHGDLVSRLTADVDRLDALALAAIGPMSTGLVAGVGVAALLALVLPAAVPIFATGYLLVAFVAPALAIAWARNAARRSAEDSAALRTTVLDAIAGHMDLAALGATARMERSVCAAAERISAANRLQSRRIAILATTAQSAAGLTSLAVIWIGVVALHRGDIAGATLVGAILASLAGLELAAGLVRNVEKVGPGLAAARRIEEIAAAPPTVFEPAVPTAPSGARIELADIIVYRRPERAVLRDLSLTVAAGERVAILGESGAGKSTLFDVLCKLKGYEAGSARLGGVELRDLASSAVHGLVATMTQSSPVFSGTVRDNLLIGDPSATDAQLLRTLKQARLDVKIAELPDGLDTWLGEGGRRLSGGEARRLCLARTLASSAAILLLDEPTSGLDADTERAFFADLRQAVGGRTVLLATHALLPPGAVDRTLILRGGRLIEAPG